MVSKGATKLQRLSRAVEHHFEQLRVLRDTREELLNAAAGSLYPHASKSDRHLDILNLMRQAAEAQTLTLAANRPRVLAVAKTVERQVFADHYRDAINAYSKQMHLEEVLQDCARNSFYSLGIAKVFMADSTAVELEADEWMDPGQPFVQSISPHHFCYDTDATHFRHCSFMADRYRVRFEDVIEDTRFPIEVRQQIRQQGPQRLNRWDQAEWGMPLHAGNDPSEFEEFVYLCDIFLPKDGVILTYACDERFRLIGDPLNEVEWRGTEQGPYYFLNFGPVPDKTTPSSPAQNLLLQHDLVNTLYRKLEDQTVRQKQLGVGDLGGEDDVTKFRDAEDGEWINVSGGKNAVDTVRFDGPDQNVFGFTLNAMEQFNKQAGNVDHQLGLSASADTAKQQGMIGANVSRMEEFYQGRFVTFTRAIIRELGRLLFEDATTRIDMTRDIPGTTFSVDAPWLGSVQEGARQGKFNDYDLDIEPYSMKYRSPESRVQELDAQVQMVMPMLPILQQQGKTIDLDWYFKTRAEYTDQPELGRLLKDLPPPPTAEDPNGPQHERLLPAGGQGGEYVHTNVNGGGGGGPDPMQMMQGAESG